MRRWFAVLVVLLSTACSLPLSHDVSTVRAVEAQRRTSGDIQVLPPGPKPGDTPEGVVAGFLGAQANAEDQHAIARQFLTAAEAASWEDDAEVQVYDPDRQVDPPKRLAGGPAGTAVVVVSSSIIGQIRRDGSFQATPARILEERYALERDRSGQWRLSHVPTGLRLTAADRDRAYQPASVFYLAQAAPDAAAHLVPDQVFLPRGNDLATALVTRLLRGPSLAIARAVTTAVPSGTRVKKVSTSGSGVVTVDLTGPVAGQPAAVQEGLSAQLIWTLRGLGPAFTGMRLLQSGTPVKVPTVQEVQDATDWAGFDPEGLGPTPPYFFVAGRRLRSSTQLASGPATAGGPTDRGSLAVDAVAVTPDRTQVALLSGTAPGLVTVSTGPLRGPYVTGPRAAGLASPSWGSGQYGLWLVQAQRRVVLLPSGGRALRPVPVDGLPPGAVQALALSRDGGRAALVIGEQLWVGQVELDGTPRIVGLTRVLPTLTKVLALAWASGTELAVVGDLVRVDQVLRLAVDGSSVTALNSTGITPVSVTASSAGVLVGDGTSIFLAGRSFARVQEGAEPVYPG